jgi:peroxiredoxin family protein
MHVYQPGFLYVALGLANGQWLARDERTLLRKDVELAVAGAERIEPDAGMVSLTHGGTIPFDYLVIATGARLVPELFPLVRDDVWITDENWMQKLLSAMNRGGTENLKLSKMNFAGAGPAMMRKLARDHKVASPKELLEMAQDMGVHLIPCQMTMDLMGLKPKDLIHGLEAPAGATTALLEAKGATTLFI